MKCVHEDRPCPFREWVCRDGMCWWNCGWDCMRGIPPFECGLAEELGFCPYNCIYEALEGECPHKQELRKQLLEGREVTE